MFGRGPTGFVSDGDAVAQCVYAALKLTLGEWFLDASKGVAWFRQPAGRPSIMDQQYDDAFLTAELKRVILKVDGVAAIAAFNFTLDRVTRKGVLNARISTIYDSVEVISARFDL